jgi:hypothetical protein
VHAVSLALISLWVAVGAVSCTTAITAGLRGIAALAATRRERYRERVSEQLAAFAVGASDEPPAAPRGRLEQRVMHQELARLAPNLKGAARELLGSLFVSYGLIESARRDLRSEHPIAAIRAADLVGIMGATETAPLLRGRLSDPDPLIRLACARALAELGVVAAIPEIVQALSDGGGRGSELGGILLSFGAASAPLLRRRLREAPSPQERRQAAVALGEIHANAAVPELVAALCDPDDEVCTRAMRALAAIGDGAAVAPMISLLERPRSWFVHVAAATALGMLDDPAAAPSLARTLNAEDWALRNAAARALVDLGDSGLEAVLGRIDEISSPGIAHLAGLLDVADRMRPIIDRAAAGDVGMDRFARTACAAGVRCRMDEVASSEDSASQYATEVLESVGATA